MGTTRQQQLHLLLVVQAEGRVVWAIEKDKSWEWMAKTKIENNELGRKNVFNEKVIMHKNVRKMSQVAKWVSYS